MSSRRTLGALRTYVSVPTQPYFIAEVAGEEPLSSNNVLDFFSNQAITSIQNTAFDVGQVLMRNAYEKSISSMRNLVKESAERFRRRSAMAFLLPDIQPVTPVNYDDDDEYDDDDDDDDVLDDDDSATPTDEVLMLVVALLQDTPNERSSDLVKQTSRDGMSPMAHGEYILVVYDAIMGDFVDELVRLFASLLERHDANDAIRPILQEVVHQYRANLRAYLRRFGVWV